MEDVSVAIIIVHISGASALDRCIASVQKNVEMPYELYIINDGGKIKSDHSGIEIIQTPQAKGFAYCANLALELTQQPILILLDSNTYVTKNSLALLVDALYSQENYGIAGPSTSLAWGEQGILNRQLNSINEIEAFGKTCCDRYGNEITVLDRLYNISQFCYAFKRELVNKIGYFDQAYGLGDCAEIDYNTRAAKTRYQCVWVKGAYVHHYKTTTRLHRKREALFERNKRIYQNRFCQLQIDKKGREYCSGCLGENSEYFAKSPQIYVKKPPAEKIGNDLNTIGHIKPNGKNGKNGRISHRELLVSCIMPTFNRRPFIQQAIKYFQSQDYPQKELIIVDDGSDPIEDIVNEESNVRYIRLNQKQSIGNKRNLAVEKSRGEIILHWDDDDWYGPERISYQLNEMTKKSGQISGLETGFLFNIVENQFWQCEAKLHARMFYADVHGGTLMFHKSVWERSAKFPNTSLAEDAGFLAAAARKRVKIVKVINKGVYVYIRHDSNAWEFICGKYIDPRAWGKIDPPSFLPGEDLDFYKDVAAKLLLNSESYKRRGDLFRNSENYKEALQYYDRALELDPSNIWAWYDKGQALEKLCRNEEALEAVLAANKLLHHQDGNRTWIHSGLGQIYIKLGKKQEAKIQFARALQHNCQNHIAREALRKVKP